MMRAFFYINFRINFDIFFLFFYVNFLTIRIYVISLKNLFETVPDCKNRGRVAEENGYNIWDDTMDLISLREISFIIYQQK